MEETEAMAIQFSSLDTADDTLPKLPEHIIHRILRLLPCMKDLVRTSVVSKTWLQAYSTFPLLEFNLKEFVPCSRSLSGEEIDAKYKQFVECVDNRLKRIGKQNGDGNSDVIKVFSLSTVNEMAHHHAARWVGKALDGKVEHLSLSIITEKNWLKLPRNDSPQLPCLIPDRVLSANWLQSLILVGPGICIPLTESSSRVDLPLLLCLHIQYSDIADEQLQKLLSGCPALEYIALLECDSLSKVDIFEHPNLETLEVTARRAKANLSAIEVRAPKLKSFSYTFVCMDGPGSDRHDIVVNIHNSPELKSLTIRDWSRTEEWFHNFIAQFPLLENLTIDGCIRLGKITISNPLLEEIKIMSCFSLVDVIISCKKLASFFLFTNPSSMLHTSIQMKMDNPPSDCMAHICAPAPLKWDVMMDASWYSKLKEFLTRHVMFKSLIITVQAFSAVDGDMKGKHVHKKLPRAACNIENLRLDVIAPSSCDSCHSHILNGVLSACHPTTIKLNGIADNPFALPTKNNPFVKVVCEELSNRGNKSKCCCKGAFKCWKHQLKEVKIEKIKGIKLEEEDLDWDALFGLLPTLEAGNDIYFRLVW